MLVLITKGLHESTISQYHSPRVEINDNQQSKPIFHQPKPTIQQYPPLALMVIPTFMSILGPQNTVISPHQFFYLYPFDINGKGFLSLGLISPLLKSPWGCSPFLHASDYSLSLSHLTKD
jgi:hypothetical protein